MRRLGETKRGLQHYSAAGTGSKRQLAVIFLEYPLDLTRFFSEKHLIQFSADKMQDFRNFALHNCILIFDAEHIYLNQVSNFKNKEVTANPKPQTLRKKLVYRKP